MTGPALAAAFARLERAVDRVERAALGRETRAADLAEAFVLLQERHALLRDRVGQTVSRLDRMLEAPAAG